jgi:hypothetical protein
MKKIKLDARKLQLKKEKISSLTNEQMGQVFGGQPKTTATLQNCCAPTTATGGYCPPPPTVGACTGTCPDNTCSGNNTCIECSL